MTTLLALGTPAFSQSVETPPDDEWDVTIDSDKNLTMASAYFGGGVALATRCLDGAFDVLIAGLPKVDDDTQRVLMTSLGAEDEEQPESWTVGTPGTVAMSHYPAPFARRLREGGELNIVVPGEDGAPNRRYILPLPPSPQAVEDTLTACGRPLDDPRDERLRPWLAPDGTPTGAEWARRPEPEYPSEARVSHAQVVVSCVTSDRGRLEDCVVESEHPAGHGFGKAVRRSTFGALLRASDPDVPIGGRMISWRTVFRVKE